MSISSAYPDILLNGAPADATQVMADFYQIQNDVNANAAANGANSDITSLTGLSTPLGIAYGGTSGATAAAARAALAVLGVAANLSDVANAPTALANLGAAALAGATFTGGVTGTTLNLSGLLTSGAGMNLTGTLAVTGGGSFTVSPTAPTPSTNDSTTKVATTAFVNPASSLSGNGYQKLASGLIIQWGTAVISTAYPGSTITFPLAFPSTCYSVVIVATSNGGSPGNVYAAINQSTISTSGFKATSNIATPGICYVAIGN